MPLPVHWTERAVKDLGQLPRSIADRIISKVEHFGSLSDPLAHAKSLHGELQHIFRFRIGDYRALFRKDQTGKITVLLILRVKHRKDVYE